MTASEYGGIVIMAPASWFEGYVNLKTFDGTNMDVLGATSLKDMFKGDKSLTDIEGIDTWHTGGVNDTPGISDFSGMFSGCTVLGDATIARLASWDVKDATTMASMFEAAPGSSS